MSIGWQVFHLSSLLNLFFCAGILWACICRLNTDLCRAYLLPRLRYTLMAGGSMVCGMQPIFFGTAIAPGTAFFTGCLLSGLLLNVARWRTGPHTPKRRKGDK